MKGRKKEPDELEEIQKGRERDQQTEPDWSFLRGLCQNL
ncbi:unnamed protein product [Brassica oleracea var. botrytis]